uniref:Pleiomorphic adenoma gene 1 n=1 Tax=Hippocampus comes TaxID=109280 RepID=A0A3Q2XJR9_HIPCM
RYALVKAKPAPAAGRRRRAEAKPKRNFPCQDCQKAFNSLEKLKVHSYSHTGERPYRCSHPGCAKAFVSKYKLFRHTATHSPEKSHKCSYCEKMFHRKDHLKNHLHIHDPHKEAFACRHCGKSYNTKLGFKRHLALHAANSGDLTCQVCLRPFPSTAALLEHLKSHAGKSAAGGVKEKKHPCEHCERHFYTRKDVRRHMVVHTGRKDFLCQYCAQRFGRKDHLTRHVKKSHPQELLRVKAEPVVYDLASGGMKAELPDAPPPRDLVLDPEPFSNAGELESYLLELQSGLPSSSGSSTKMATSVAGDWLASSSLMDFSQLFNFLPLPGPPCNHTGGGEGQQTLAPESPHLRPPPEPSQGPQAALQSQAPFICNLSAPTTLPRFHQAFQ